MERVARSWNGALRGCFLTAESECVEVYWAALGWRVLLNLQNLCYLEVCRQAEFYQWFFFSRDSIWEINIHYMIFCNKQLIALGLFLFLFLFLFFFGFILVRKCAFLFAFVLASMQTRSCWCMELHRQVSLRRLGPLCITSRKLKWKPTTLANCIQFMLVVGVYDTWNSDV